MTAILDGGCTLQLRDGAGSNLRRQSLRRVTAPDLAAITGTLTLNSVGLTALAAGDFDGLTSLSELHRKSTGCPRFRDDVIQPLTALTGHRKTTS